MFSVLYCTNDEIFNVGPFKTEAEADTYVREHSYPKKDYEFDLNEQNVYLLRPDHSMVPYPSDFGTADEAAE